ncbi:MAG: ATP-binding protein [Rhodospirillaceae bacterium]|nr:ATP-binding protein [Rhodospirillaceae bacterium]
MPNAAQPIAVYAMCGLAFSGKSTAAKVIAGALGVALIVLDAINHERGLHGGDGLTIAQWEETSFMAMDRTRAFLKAGRSVVVDDTFSHRHLRDRCKGVAEETRARFVIIYIDTPLDVIQARRRQNEVNPTRDYLRDPVFDWHYKNFQYPTDDEPLVRIGSDQELTAWIAAEKAKSR